MLTNAGEVTSPGKIRRSCTLGQIKPAWTTRDRSTCSRPFRTLGQGVCFPKRDSKIVPFG